MAMIYSTHKAITSQPILMGIILTANRLVLSEHQIVQACVFIKFFVSTALTNVFLCYNVNMLKRKDN